MNVTNVELYSIIILAILLLDYISKFRKNFTTASKLWITITVSAFLISFSNLLFYMHDNYVIKVISIVLYLLSIITCSVFTYIYVKLMFIKNDLDIKKEINYAIISII